MLFRRRNQLGFFDRLRQAVWPTRSWRRSASYYFKRVLRLSATPHAIAAGFAAGVFASFTPFVGLHFIISFVVAFLLGGNILAAAFGTAVGNPLTFPAIWITTYNIGSMLLGHHPGRLSPHEIFTAITKQPLDSVFPLVGTMLIGGIPLGLIFGIAAYAVTWWAVMSYQNRRRKRLAERRPVDPAEAAAETQEGQ